MEINVDNLEREVSDYLLKHNTLFTRWCVITGAPSSGKTSIIQELASKGFKTNHDISRQYLERLISKGISKLDARQSEENLQRMLFLLMVKNEMDLPTNELIFLDYALPDNFAFQRMANINLRGDVLKSLTVFRYWQVFIMEPLPFESDHVRTENTEYQTEITELLESVYKDLGYDCIRVPAFNIRKRIEYILDRLKN
jgi:predicted ATPase